MLIDWSDEFNTWLDRLEDHAHNDPISARRLDYITAQLQHLQELTDAPEEDTAHLRRVRQSKTYPVWRLAHPYDPDIAVRLIVWFPDDEHVVVALFSGTRRAWGMCSTRASDRAPMLRSRRGNSRPRLREVRADE